MAMPLRDGQRVRFIHKSERPWYRADDSPERNAKARKAYEALMTVTLRKPTSPEYRQFSKTVKEKAEEMYRHQNFTYGEEEVNSFVGAFHDAVILYALALNESLEAGIPVSNGSEITRRMWNRTFEVIAHFTVALRQLLPTSQWPCGSYCPLHSGPAAVIAHFTVALRQLLPTSQWPCGSYCPLHSCPAAVIAHFTVALRQEKGTTCCTILFACILLFSLRTNNVISQLTGEKMPFEKFLYCS
ncbi:hypothetical protein ACOMHN_022929 [Nucella lapillus]